MIILNMIVKNEAHCIERCIASVLPFINGAVIVDTGSTDNTKALLEKMLRHVPHRIASRPWVDFSHNRTEAFRAAQKRFNSGYAFVIDADEEFRHEPDFRMPRLKLPVYGIWNTVHGGGRYVKSQLLSLKHDFYWTGVLHEEVQCTKDIKGDLLKDCSTFGHFDSARNKNPMKYQHDATILRAQPQTPRNVFYLGRTLLDAGDLEGARVALQKRVTMAGCDQEKYYAMLLVARILQALKQPPEMVIQAYCDAYTFRPHRAETLRYLGQYQLSIGNKQQYELNHEIADMKPMTTDTLFVDPRAYVA